MPDLDDQLAALAALSRLARICLVEAAIETPEQTYPLEAHLRLVGIRGARRPMFSITSPGMEIGRSYIPRSTLADRADALLAARAAGAGETIDANRLNTARTIARFQIASPPSAHDLIELLGEAQTGDPHVL